MEGDDGLSLRRVDINKWDSAVAKQYKIRSIPHLLLFDDSGRLLAKGTQEVMNRVVLRKAKRDSSVISSR